MGLNAGGVRTLEKAKEVYAAGYGRIAVTATAAILDGWKAELGGQALAGFNPGDAPSLTVTQLCDPQ